MADDDDDDDVDVGDGDGIGTSMGRKRRRTRPKPSSAFAPPTAPEPSSAPEMMMEKSTAVEAPEPDMGTAVKAKAPEPSSAPEMMMEKPAAVVAAASSNAPSSDDDEGHVFRPIDQDEREIFASMRLACEAIDQDKREIFARSSPEPTAVEAQFVRCTAVQVEAQFVKCTAVEAPEPDMGTAVASMERYFSDMPRPPPCVPPKKLIAEATPPAPRAAGSFRSAWTGRLGPPSPLPTVEATPPAPGAVEATPPPSPLLALQVSARLASDWQARADWQAHSDWQAHGDDGDWQAHSDWQAHADDWPPHADDWQASSDPFMAPRWCLGGWQAPTRAWVDDEEIVLRWCWWCQDTTYVKKGCIRCNPDNIDWAAVMRERCRGDE